MKICTDKFKATILKDMGSVTISDTLIHRVLIVRDEVNRLKISFQVWWRDEGGDIWNPGKGYFLVPRHALSIRRMLSRISEPVDEFLDSITITNTQKYVVNKKAEDSFLTLEKWWKKGEEEPWTMGKSLVIDLKHVQALSALLNTAGLTTIHIK